MIGYRRAALYLHGLSEADRGWVLRSLADDERTELGRLLRELETMGIPRDQTWVVPALNRPSDSQLDGDTDPRLELIAVLSDVPVGRVFELLNGEPDVVIATVLGCHAWTWNDAFVERMKPMRRPQVLELQSRHWPARLRDAVYAAVLQKYTRLAPQPAIAVPAARGLRGRWRRWLPKSGRRQWLR